MVTMEQFQIGFHSRSKMQSMIMELQAAVSSLCHTIDFWACSSEELRDLPMSQNDETLNQFLMKIFDFCYLSLSPDDVLLQMVIEEIFMQKWSRWSLFVMPK